jgi:hypothetical protein
LYLHGFEISGVSYTALGKEITKPRFCFKIRLSFVTLYRGHFTRCFLGKNSTISLLIDSCFENCRLSRISVESSIAHTPLLHSVNYPLKDFQLRNQPLSKNSK